MGQDAKTELARNLEQALALLGERPGLLPALSSTEPLHSLLAQCEKFVSARSEKAPIRILHHFACTGGTLISKCLALSPNVTLLSEIDPLSRIIPTKVPRFLPSDVLYAGRAALRPISEEVTINCFNASIAEMHRALDEKGSYLVLRDHAHSHYCTGIKPETRPSLRSIVGRVLPVRSALTVRHPLDSFLSIVRHKWGHFSPFTLETYAERYMLFLDEYADLRPFHYEDFVADPEAVLQQICEQLQLPFQPGTAQLLKAVKMSGDSGRSSTQIAPRGRGHVPKGILEQARSSLAYHNLCERLDYQVDHA